MTENNKIFEISVIVAARKNAFFKAFWEDYSKKISPDSSNTVYNILLNIVSSLDNDLFIGAQEKRLKKIDADLKLSQLGLDTNKIERQIIQKIGASQQS